MTLAARIKNDVELPSGTRALLLVSLDAIGLAVNGRACIVHSRWMTAEQLHVVSTWTVELANWLDEREAA